SSKDHASGEAESSGESDSSKDNTSGEAGFLGLSRMTPVGNSWDADDDGEKERSLLLPAASGFLAVGLLLMVTFVIIGSFRLTWNDPQCEADATTIVEERLMDLLDENTRFLNQHGEYLGLAGSGRRRGKDPESGRSRLELVRTARYEHRDFPLMIYVYRGESLDLKDVVPFQVADMKDGDPTWQEPEGHAFHIDHPLFSPSSSKKIPYPTEQVAPPDQPSGFGAKDF
ncbi:MAG: hypothetical protein N2C14_04840, partial [Planctomycetales bacterium]